MVLLRKHHHANVVGLSLGGIIGKNLFVDRVYAKLWRKLEMKLLAAASRWCSIAAYHLNDKRCAAGIGSRLQAVAAVGVVKPVARDGGSVISLPFTRFIWQVFATIRAEKFTSMPLSSAWLRVGQCPANSVVSSTSVGRIKRGICRILPANDLLVGNDKRDR